MVREINIITYYLLRLQPLAKWFAVYLMHLCVLPTCTPHHQEPISAAQVWRYLRVAHLYRTLPMWHLDDLGTTYPGC